MLALSLCLARHRTTGIQPFAWVPWGVYIGLPPRGTMVIWPGGRTQLSVSLVADFSAGSWVPPPGGSLRLSRTWPTGRARHLRVLPAA